MTRRRSVRALLRHPIVRNALALYWLQVAAFVIPLITVPYLARVLGPAELGVVVLTQSFALWLGVVVDYGFALSAARDVARVREDRAALESIAAGVLGGKALLLLASLALASAAAILVPVFRAEPQYLALGWLLTAAAGLTPRWYFQGLERLRLPTYLALGGQAVTAALVIVWVQGSGDGWKVILLQALAAVVSLVVITVLMYREVGARAPRRGESLVALRGGWSLFVFSAAVSLYTTANAFLLGLVAPTAQVAYFGSAERLVRAAQKVTGPISEAVFPRMSFLFAKASTDRARRLALLTLGAQLALALCATAALILLAPVIVSVLLGPGFEPAVAVLRILSLTLPLLALSNVVGLQWMLSMGMDRTVVRIIVAAGVLNVALALTLASRFGPVGMAWAVVLVELGVVVALTAASRGSWRAVAPPPEAEAVGS